MQKDIKLFLCEKNIACALNFYKRLCRLYKRHCCLHKRQWRLYRRHWRLKNLWEKKKFSGQASVFFWEEACIYCKYSRFVVTQCPASHSLSVRRRTPPPCREVAPEGPEGFPTHVSFRKGNKRGFTSRADFIKSLFKFSNKMICQVSFGFVSGLFPRFYRQIARYPPYKIRKTFSETILKIDQSKI